MHKEVDFIAEYNEEMKELLAEPQTSPSEREWQRFRLSMELVNAQESQYTRVKNEERWKRLEQEFYPALCVIAKTQGGRVELNIKEDTLIGQLVYIGEGLRFLYNGIIIKHQKTEPTYTKTSLFLCEKRRFFMARREKGVVPIIYFEKERGKSF